VNRTLFLTPAYGKRAGVFFLKAFPAAPGFYRIQCQIATYMSIVWAFENG
jgi:hypothetical protein